MRRLNQHNRELYAMARRLLLLVISAVLSSALPTNSLATAKGTTEVLAARLEQLQRENTELNINAMQAENDALKSATASKMPVPADDKIALAGIPGRGPWSLHGDAPGTEGRGAPCTPRSCPWNPAQCKDKFKGPSNPTGVCECMPRPVRKVPYKMYGHRTFGQSFRGSEAGHMGMDVQTEMKANMYFCTYYSASECLSNAPAAGSDSVPSTYCIPNPQIALFTPCDASSATACPSWASNRYPGNNRCFEHVWGGKSCNVDPANDPNAHQQGDKQCNCASQVEADCAAASASQLPEKCAK
jgi:hypothetical protein